MECDGGFSSPAFMKVPLVERKWRNSRKIRFFSNSKFIFGVCVCVCPSLLDSVGDLDSLTVVYRGTKSWVVPVPASYLIVDRHIYRGHMVQPFPEMQEYVLSL